MIIIRKKYIISILACAIVLIGIIGVRSNVEYEKTIQTVALPVENKVIIIDSGHGFPDERCF